MSASRVARAIVRGASWFVPADARDDWRREWRAELEWSAHEGRSRLRQVWRAAGAWPHAWWLMTDRWRWDVIGQDLRHGARALAARPGFTLVAGVSLAIGIGANVAMFTVVDGVLLRPLPFADASRVIQLANGDSAATLSEPELIDVSRDAGRLASTGAYSFTDANVTSGGQDAERVRAARVTDGFFGVLDTPPLLGRAFTPDEDRPGGASVAVISHGLWQRRLASDPAAIGRPLTINGVPRVIIGVMPPRFDFPAAAVDVWLPLQLNRAAPGERRNHSFRLIARLARGVTVAQAQEQVQAIKAHWAADYPETYDPKRPLIADVVPIEERVFGAARPYLLALFGAVGLLLVIACANVASLLLVRGESRGKEMAIRGALGASRFRLMRQLFIESALLTAAGGAAGVFLAWPAVRLLVAAAPGSIPRLGEIRLDGGVMVFAVLVSVATGVIFGLAPALRGGSALNFGALRDGGKTSQAVSGPGTRRTHALLVVAEIALAVVMLTGAGLLTRSLLNLQRTDLGFVPDGVLTARVVLPRASYSDVRAVAAVDAIVARLAHTPGVKHAAAMAWTPIVDGGGMWSIAGDLDAPVTNGQAPLAAPQQITPEFFAAMSIPIVRGRAFSAADRGDAPLVAIVNETLAKTLWRGADAIGRRMRMESPDAPWATVVGVVRDARVDGLTEPKPPMMYFPHAQAGRSAYFTSLGMTLVLSPTGDDAPLVAEIRRVVRETDPNLPVAEIRTMNQIVGSTIANQRFTAVLVCGFAALAVVLAGVGIFGVMAYVVAQRRYEIGVRLALGARKSTILGDVIRRGATLAGAGLAIGLAGAVAAARVMNTILVGVSAFDAWTIGAVTLLVLVVASMALVVPARRAMGVDPVESLRPSH